MTKKYLIENPENFYNELLEIKNKAINIIKNTDDENFGIEEKSEGTIDSMIYSLVSYK
jgi:hypothetical protein